MNSFKNSEGKSILLNMVKAIQENKAFLGEVDGLIGDGDHGMNMNKGFSLFEKRHAEEEFSFSEGLNKLSFILMNEIGGSMGPIYGTIFIEMGDAIDNTEKDDVTLVEFANCLKAGLEGLCEIVEARVGDKTLVDTLSPAVASLERDVEAGTDYGKALDNMKAEAEKGRDSTKNMQARYGRSSRLGERSLGVLDAGACSCCILLQAMAEGIKELLV